jgi:hypothetical protein
MTTLEERLSALRQKLSTAEKPAGTRARSDTSMLSLIEAARGDIAKLRTQGWTWKAISDGADGALGSAELIRQAITGKLARKKKPTSASRKSTKPAPVPVIPRAVTTPTAPASTPDEPFGADA